MKHFLLVSLLFLVATSALPVLAQDQVLWTDQETDKIYAVNPGDLGSQAEVQNTMNPGGVAYYHANAAGPLFFATSNNIHRGNLTKTQSPIVNAGIINRGVAIDFISKKIYWADDISNTISRANLDGTGQELSFLTTGVIAPFDIEVDPLNGKIYWTEVGPSNDIKRANLSDGSNVEKVIEKLNWCQGIAIDYIRNRIYYNVLSGQVYGASLDDPSDAQAITGLNVSFDLDVDIATGTLYLASGSGLKNLTKANPDGTGKVSVNLPGAAFFVAYADKTAPFISSITRHNPLSPTVAENGTATFRITFSEPVMRVDKTDFGIEGSITGNISVSPVSLNKIYDVVISDLSGTGALGLKIASGHDILDFGGNAFTGSIAAKEAYTVVATPVITSFSPVSGPVGTTVTINGSNFGSTTFDNTVTFNGISATVENATTTSLIVTVPAGATDGPVVVSVGGLSTTSAADFVVCVVPAKPVISVDGDVLTSSAVENNQWLVDHVAIAGATDATFTVVDPGEYSVRVLNGVCLATSDPFVVTTEMLTPSITSFDPTSGTPGTSIVITGSFINEVTLVNFNGVAAEVTSASKTSITAVVPAGAGTGPITVTCNGRSGESVGDFTYLCIDPPKPVIAYNGGVLTSSSDENNQWFRNGSAIPSATGKTYTAIGPGAYTVRVSNDGCFSESDPTTIVGLEETLTSAVKVYPNPVRDNFRVSFPPLESSATICIYSLTGVEKERRVLTPADGSAADFNISHYPTGMYVVVISTTEGRLIRKLRKM